MRSLGGVSFPSSGPTYAKPILPTEGYPLLEDPYFGKASMTQVGELTTHGRSTAYSPVPWNN